MKDFLNEVEEAYKAGFHRLSLFGLLAVPDICGAMRQEDGESSKDHYVYWYNKYVNPIYNGSGSGRESLSAEDTYYWRSSVLHQGKSSPREKRQEHEGYNRIAFTPLSNFNIKIRRHMHDDTDIVFIHVCMHTLMDAILKGFQQFCEDEKDNDIVNKNMDKFLKFYPQGLAQAKIPLYA